MSKLFLIVSVRAELKTIWKQLFTLVTNYPHFISDVYENVSPIVYYMTCTINIVSFSYYLLQNCWSNLLSSIISCYLSFVSYPLWYKIDKVIATFIFNVFVVVKYLEDEKQLEQVLSKMNIWKTIVFVWIFCTLRNLIWNCI